MSFVSFFQDLKEKASAEIEELKADGRALDDKIHEFFHLGVLHAKLASLDDKFKHELEQLKAAAEVKLREDVKKLRDALNEEVAKVREDAKNAFK